MLDVLSSADCPPHFRANTSSASVATAEDPKSVLGFCSEVCEFSHVNFSHSSAFSLYFKEFLGMMAVSYSICMNDDDAVVNSILPPPYTSLPSEPLVARSSQVSLVLLEVPSC